MPTTVTLDDDTAHRCQAEADRTFDGDLAVTVTAGLTYYLGMQESQHAIADTVPPLPDEPEETRLARAVTAANIPMSTVESIGNILLRVAGAGPPPVAPRQHVQPYLDWAQSHPLDHQVGCLLVSAQPPGGDFGSHRTPVVGFARGFLRAVGNTLAGDLAEYFSDRTAGTAAAPFDPGRIDRVGVSVSVDPLAATVTVALVAHDWGEARQTLYDLRVENGLLVGTGASVGNQTATALYALSFYTVVVPG